MIRLGLTLLLVATVTPALAAERALSAAETQKLLAGNTVLGTGESGATRQYFDPNGDTLFIAADGAPSDGRWRMEGDQYCSTWPPAQHWSCYAVQGDPDATPQTIRWIDREGFASPGTVVKGNQIR